MRSISTVVSTAVLTARPLVYTAAHSAGVVLSLLMLSSGLAAPANAEEPLVLAQAAGETSQEIDSSATRDYAPATIYLYNPTAHELVPSSVLVTTDEPVETAVNQIIESYEGQDLGIQDYQVTIDPDQQSAEIDFLVNDPREAKVFLSLSSANQFSLFEAIRETLLTQPIYDIEEVHFSANGTAFDI